MVFGAGPYAPETLTDREREQGHPPRADSGESADIPEWLWPDFRASLGDNAQGVADAMRNRAPVYLRVNLARLSREQAVTDLAAEGIVARSHSLSPSALEVTEGARKVGRSKAYLRGNVELQDASSQAVADLVPLEPGGALLDFCAGGGGKVLAVAGRVPGKFFAHDVDRGRLKDLPERASRAGAIVKLVSLPEVEEHAPFESVLVDAPCSGSGSWRRDPQGKWLLIADKLRQTIDIQKEILRQASQFIKPRGYLTYATCSLLESENGEQVRDFLRLNSDFSLVIEKRFTPLDGGDGFYCAVLRKD
ncbi:MAG: RsmB/NOP family class I SAM-dependent RNA methyltransferase [Paracoccaceae bacterium]